MENLCLQSTNEVIRGRRHKLHALVLQERSSLNQMEEFWTIHLYHKHVQFHEVVGKKGEITDLFLATQKEVKMHIFRIYTQDAPVFYDQEE